MTDAAPETALVTGASRGLGAVISRRLAADGHAVAVNHRSSGDLAETVVDEIRAAGGTAEAFQADVTEGDEVDRLVAEVTDRLGPVATVVANATGPQPAVAVDDLTWNVHLDQLRFFVKSPTLLLRAVLPGMRAAGGGRFVMIGSDIVARAPARQSAYVAAKGAQQALARVWATEVGADGIAVNLVAPGWTPVERHADAPDDVRDAYVADVPLGRFATPDDIAGVVAFLASDAAGFVTGQTIAVNGGHTI